MQTNAEVDGIVLAECEKFAAISQSSSATSINEDKKESSCKAMWQIISVPGRWGEAFEAILNYAQHSLNFFFCPM